MKLDEHNPLNLIQENEEVYLTLNCYDCDFIECGIAKKWVSAKSKEGCTRKVSEEIQSKFFHYIEEVIPFWCLQTKKYVRESYKEIIDFLYNEIYAAPLGQRLDPDGKVRKAGF